MSSTPSPDLHESEAARLPDAVRHALAVTRRGCSELLVESDWIAKLQRSQASGKPLRIKLGLDPTAPDIHLGHTVVLNKLRQLQDLGHTVIFLIGDFTSRIGDPSGRNTTRPPLTIEQIQANAQTYYAQASMVLDPQRTEIRYNSEWSEALGADGMIRLAARYTLARLLEREDFTQRFRAGIPIAMHELLYPLMQGYDSVALQSDLELGGTDQKFNLLVGRDLQKEYGQEPQCILTMPLLEGLDGVDKMSKSKGNYIGIQEAPASMYAKLLSINDTLMWRYFELLSFRPLEEIERLRAEVESGRNPKDAKVLLAREIVTRFHDAAAADAAQADFELRARGGVPEDIAEMRLSLPEGGLALPAALKQAGLVPSTAEALRMLEQRGVRVDGTVAEDRNLRLQAGTYVLQVGKRKFARVVLGA
ncbi:MAG: tyrosine--tRNA ligase [Betaproteobacteria bacterium]|nr:tyrosine--tRNA ligase [Betaproteobacteria bacterium]MBU6511772.1 tyrosine--tRNA ligase [Betaproteobacteria bacterium]MDE2152080.1 tyrosine--tRNA ligase [Betaproteobacteria bacterium]